MTRVDRHRWAIRFVVAALALAGACGWNDQVSQTGPVQAEVRLLVPRVVAEHPHDPRAFTQGPVLGTECHINWAMNEILTIPSVNVFRIWI